jgi:hypothetical protein
MNYMREGPQLGVAKAARAPPCTLPILGRRLPFIRQFISIKEMNLLFFLKYKKVYCMQKAPGRERQGLFDGYQILGIWLGIT